MLFQTFLCVVLSLASVQSFHLSAPTTKPDAGRRSLLESSVGILTVLVGITTTTSPLDQAVASGGATAGGVYLLSAKQRYNERVKQGVQGFLAMRPAIELGDFATAKSFFAGEDPGTWKDLSTAGYLLANAFRRNSSAAPDTLPSVKAWKAFASQVKALAESLNKKDKNAATKNYEAAVTALDNYLERVELPSAK